MGAEVRSLGVEVGELLGGTGVFGVLDRVSEERRANGDRRKYTWIA